MRSLDPHLRITVSGELGTAIPAPEIFSFGLSANFLLNSDVNQANLKTVATGIFNTALTPLMPTMSGAVKIKRVRVARIDGNGLVYRTPDGAYAQGDANGTRTGSGGLANLHPPQVAITASLRSVFAGPTGRGRFYIPMPAYSATADSLLMTAADRTAVQTAVAQFVRDVNAQLTAAGLGRVVIASGGSPARGLPPANHDVVSVYVGQAFDTIRSRRNNLVDTAAPTAL